MLNLEQLKQLYHFFLKGFKKKFDTNKEEIMQNKPTLDLNNLDHKRDVEQIILATILLKNKDGATFHQICENILKYFSNLNYGDLVTYINSLPKISQKIIRNNVYYFYN